MANWDGFDIYLEFILGDDAMRNIKDEQATWEEYVRWVESVSCDPRRSEYESFSVSELMSIKNTIIRWDEAKEKN